MPPFKSLFSLVQITIQVEPPRSLRCFSQLIVPPPPPPPPPSFRQLVLWSIISFSIFTFFHDVYPPSRALTLPAALHIACFLARCAPSFITQVVFCFCNALSP